MKAAYIYSLSDPFTNEIRYIGKTVNLKQRIYYHIAVYDKSHKSNWIKSIKLRGGFPIMEIIDSVSELEWQFWEQHYIFLYRSWGFKLTNGDHGGLGGGRISEDTRKKLSESHIGIPNKSKGIKRRPHTEEEKRKISIWNKGKIVSEETKAKMSLSQKGRTLSEEHKMKLRKPKIKRKIKV